MMLVKHRLHQSKAAGVCWCLHCHGLAKSSTSFNFNGKNQYWSEERFVLICSV